jgi:hypothetical protein
MRSPRTLTLLIATTIGGVSFAQTNNGANITVAANSTNNAQSTKNSARTSEEYRALAAHLRTQEQTFKQKAAVEKQDWEQRKQITASLYSKYPTPADSARNLYEYYTYEADQKGKQAAKYEQLANEQQTPKVALK